MDKLRRALSGQEALDEQDEERGGIITQVIDSSSLSWETRIKGFIICFVIGFLMSMLASALIFLPGGLAIFAVLYTIGNLLALGSTFFLMGPLKQLERMFATTRLIATVIMLLALAMTLVSVFILGNKMLALVMVLIQFLAMTWYSLSYIPYARDAVKKCCGSCLG